jgi:pSer/pThr/pTyr-binding forkhead associated (FHA) protein
VVLSTLAALALIVPWLATTALGQTGGGKSGTEARPKSDYLNDGVYRIGILAYFYDLYRPTQRYTATGLLIREPNVIVTTRLFDSEGNDIYANHERTGTVLWVCEQEPDPVRLAAQKREYEERGKDRDEELARFKELDRLAEDRKKARTAAKAEDIIKRYSADLAERASCVSATVKQIDRERGLVLIEAKEKLAGSVPVFNVSDPDQGTIVRAFGFPIAAEYATRRSTAAERERMRLIPTITTGTVVKTTTDSKEGQLILHQAPVSSGAWGSPLVNNCGEVVGLNQMQKNELVVKVEGRSQVTGARSGEVRVDKAFVPTSNVVAAVGARELVTFASLNGISFQNVNRSSCTASLATPFSLQQNMWTVLVGGSALLLAATALVVALRRPGPVRNTMIKMFPRMGRSSDSATLQRGYGDTYGVTARGASPGYSADSPTAAAYAPRQSAVARPADPTNLMPAGSYASPGSGGARLVPIGGGQPVALDVGRLDSGGLTFGRESTCDIVSDNSTVSKRHARITRTPQGKLQVEDLGSANGTWRGRSRIQREAFSTGDVVRFGSVEYRIELSGNGSGPTVLLPSASWVMSGSDEQGRPVHWHFQPTSDASGRQVETSWIVGRSSERADRALADKRVSAEHAKIRFTPQRGLEICDLGSSNGTRVDGKRIGDSFVSLDDARVIDFGGCTMSLSKT